MSQTNPESEELQIGQINVLKAKKYAPQGLYLEAGEIEILLPNKQVPAGVEEDEYLEVFIYSDSEDRLVATRVVPIAQRGDVACLEVSDVNSFGAFLDWGLEKDLLLPKSEQVHDVYPGDKVVVMICLDDETDRIFATARLRDHLPNQNHDYRRGKKVDYIVQEITPDGAQVVIDQTYRGMIYKDDMTKKFQVGDQGQAYIKLKREDGRLRLCLNEPGFKGVMDIKPMIMDRIDLKGGFLPLNDNSSPDEIRKEFSISKKAFKKAIGSLYKDGRIVIETDGIRLKT